MDSFSTLVNDNTINLYNAATSAAPAGNLMVSPFSILHASMLLYFGAHGTTKSNLDNALLFNRVYNADKTAALTDFSNSMSRIKSVQDETDPLHYMIVSINNAVFVDKRLTLKPSYIVAATEKLHAVALNKDFVKNPDQSREQINNWVEIKTNGLIKDLLSSDAVDSNTVAVLVNTVYYNATWATSFDREATTKEEFNNIDGTKTSVDMMIKRDDILFTRNNQMDVEYVELDYYNKETSMLILLPNKANGLRTLEKTLTASALRALKGETRRVSREIHLPKFKTESAFDLVGLLRKVGIKDAFTPSADFTEMTSSGLYFNNGVHKTFISVDEQGTVAAAASALSQSRSMAAQIEQFILNRPFLYAIRHNPTDTLLFVGRVEKF